MPGSWQWIDIMKQIKGTGGSGLEILKHHFEIFVDPNDASSWPTFWLGLEDSDYYGRIVATPIFPQKVVQTIKIKK